MHGGLLIVQLLLYISVPLLFLVISPVLFFRLLKFKKISQVVIQSYPLFIGFFFCIFLFALAILVAEFASWNTNNPFFVISLKYIIIFGILLMTGLPVILISVSQVCCSDHDVGSGQCRHQSRICVLCAIIVILIICCFAAQWAIMSSLATFLLSLAYPLHVTTLVVLHFAFVFALSVTIGVFVSETTLNHKLIINCTCTCTWLAILVILVIPISLYITIICGYAFTIVQRIVPADGVIKGLLFLPSVILFLIGWLLKKRFFGM